MNISTPQTITPFKEGLVKDGNANGIGWKYANITSGVTTQIKGSSGVLRSITVNTAVNSATITIYDNTAGSGTLMGTITLGSSAVTNTVPVYEYFTAFATGLTIVTSGATDITVAYI